MTPNATTPVLRQGAASRDFQSHPELLAHYAAVNARLWNASPPPPAPKDTTRSLVELQRERAERERVEEAQRRYFTDEATAAQVLQVLDPDKLAREPKRIIARVAAEHGLTAADITGPSRKMVVVNARFAAIAAVYDAHSDFSLPHLGRIFGGKDHTTILHALRRTGRLPSPEKGGL